MPEQPVYMFHHAEEYWHFGFDPLPIEQAKKCPAFAWKPYMERRVTEDELAKFWPEGSVRGICIHNGKKAGVTIVDCDTREDGVWWWENFPHTALISKTGGGGVHFFYTYAPGGNRAKVLGRKIDIRNDGGFLVLPPTVHPNGKRYEWVKWPVSRDSLPVFDYAWIGGSRNSKAGFVQQSVRDPIRVIMSISASPGQRDTTNALRVACILSENMKFGEALAAFRAWNIARAKPQFPDSELVRKLTEAFNRECVRDLVRRDGNGASVPT